MIVQVKGVSLRRGVPILNDVNWSMYPDQNWVILGANGSGKTSLVQVVLGYEHPSKGSCSVLGKTFGEAPWDEVRRQIGVVSQSLAQRIDGQQLPLNIVMAGKTAHLNTWHETGAEEQEEARKWLYFVGIEHLAERKWAVLSQGERQRVMIARALIPSPKLLILDEPCAGLDPVAREDFLCFLQQVLTEEFKIPTILITHHLEEVMPMFSHVLLMRSGVVIAAGRKDDILSDAYLSKVFNSEIAVESTESNRFRMQILRYQGVGA
jgi:iron complex transport system ATP-binding protein